MPSPDEIRLAYQLILDRAPNDIEIAAAQDFPSLQAMRQAFLKSREFQRKFDRMSADIARALTPTLVYLQIPGAEPDGLCALLTAQEALQPARAMDETELDDLRNQPAAEQRSLRFVHGDLGHGAGAALEGPYYDLAVICDPGPRLHWLWLGWGEGMGFGDFLTAALDDPALRLELDNGQIRRLSGDRSVDGIGREPALLRAALHNALGPRIFLGIAEAPAPLLQRLAGDGLFDGVPPDLPPRSPHPRFEADLAALSPEHRRIFDGYTAWDGYAHDVCRQLLADLDETPA